MGGHHMNIRLQSRLLSFIVACTMCLSLFSVAAAEESGGYEVGDKIDDFTITTADDQVIQLSELLKEKKAVVLNLWYIDCYYCNLEFPTIEQVYQAMNDDIEIVALSPFGLL